MKRRILATFLWFMTFWYAGALIADVFHLNPILGPMLGAAAAALLFVGDPRRATWRPEHRSHGSAALDTD